MVLGCERLTLTPLNRGGSGWYHEACYWRRHNAILIDDGARAYDCNEA